MWTIRIDPACASARPTASFVAVPTALGTCIWSAAAGRSTCQTASSRAHGVDQLHQRRRESFGCRSASRLSRPAGRRRRRELAPVVLASSDPVVTVLGGTGRIGGLVAAALRRWQPDVALRLAGRNRQRGEAAALQLGGTCAFVEADLSDEESLQRAIEGSDLVVHVAGPFQAGDEGSLNALRASVAGGVPYVDVADDAKYAARATGELRAAARAAGVPALVTTGVFPGISNLMAAEVVDRIRRDRRPAEELEFLYFTAGTGGAGPTILASTFLLAAEPVTVYVAGEPRREAAISRRRVVDFGPRVGRRATFLYQLPEVESAHRVLGVPSVSARFGTAPELWNVATRGMALLAPRAFLRSRPAVRAFVDAIEPVVRSVDRLVGSSTAVRVQAAGGGASRNALLFAPDTADAAARGAVAMGIEALEGRVPAGVWYPEEAFATGERRRAVFERFLALEERPASALDFDVPFSDPS